jgi:DNA-binding response OmpR family regulator
VGENRAVKRLEKNGRRILVIDDEQNICDLLQLVLSFHGFEVDGAASGAEAESLLQQTHFDAVTIDLQLPDITGEELAAKLRAAHPTMGVAILSGGDPDKELPEGVAFLRKPTEMMELIAAIKRISGVAA